LTINAYLQMRGGSGTSKFLSVHPVQLRRSFWYSGASSSVVPLANAFAAPIMVFDAQEAKIQLMHRLKYNKYKYNKYIKLYFLFFFSRVKWSFC
jgi:hypothetical protein